jgi:hypothetical protein
MSVASRLRAFRYKQCERNLDFAYSCQASAEHFQQCAKFPLVRNRGLSALAVTVLPIALARRAAATLCAAV